MRTFTPDFISLVLTVAMCSIFGVDLE
jgi:hypothetical protein